MWLYNTIFILLAFVIEKKNKKKVFFIWMFIFWLMSFLRWEVGTDWNSYIKTFNTRSIENMVYVNEIGYRYLNFIIREITDKYTLFLLVQATIIFICKGKFIYKFSKNWVLSLLLNFSTYKGDIFFTRQGIAVAISCFSIDYVFKRKFVKFFITILCATMIHKSAIIFMIVYPLVNYVKVTRKKCILIILLGYCSYFFNVEIIQVLAKIGSFFSNFGGDIIGTKLLSYLERSNNVFGYKTFLSKTTIILGSLANRSLILGIMLIFYKKLDRFDKKLIYIYTFSYFIMLSFGTISLTLSRLTEYFQVVEIVVLANIYEKISKKYKLLAIVIVCLYLYLKLVSWISGYYSLYIPYKTIFNF